MAISKVAETIRQLQEEIVKARDGEIMAADECLSHTSTITTTRANGAQKTSKSHVWLRHGNA